MKVNEHRSGTVSLVVEKGPLGKDTTTVDVQKFFQESGFKLLALAKLSQCEYSCVLYLLNCAVSGLDDVVTNESELASLIGYDEQELSEALTNLAERGIIKIHVGKHNPQGEHPSIRVGIHFTVSSWQIDADQELTANDAIVYPFRRNPNHSNLYILEDRSPGRKETGKDVPQTWERVMQSFTASRELNEEETEKAQESAKVLVETHPVDQVLLMLRHFGDRIPSLSLLASSWQHYQEMFESETQKVDLMGARTKHIQLDQQLREESISWLEKQGELGLTKDEVEVLQIIVKHRHPRRQLFWAYQARSRYPHLGEFFEKNSPIMLPVTTGGAIVKKNINRPE